MVLSNLAARRLADEPRSVAAVDPEQSEAFDVLYRRYFPRLVAMCKRRVRDTALAEDIAQETLLRALLHLDRIDRSRPPWPWLKTIATNLIVDHARKHARLVSCEDHEDHPSEAPSSVEDTDLLRRAIGCLPGRQRAAVALRYINDWDTHEAAHFLGVSRPAYEQLLFRARRKLRDEYRRLAGEAFGGVAIGTRWLRDVARRASDRMRQAGMNVAPLGELGSLGASQLAGGALALVVTLGSPGAVAVPPAIGIASHPTSAQALAAGPGSRAAASHRDGSQGSASSRAPMTVPPANDAPPASSNEGLNARAGTARRDLDGLAGEDVSQPEDARITSIALSPTFDRDGTMFAAGRGECDSELCSSVLFESTDGGATWIRLPARAFEAEVVALPPNFGNGDARIFAMGRVGLEVSDDGGETFAPAAPAGAPYAIGSVAISPAFAGGDPSILIGSQTLTRYRDDTKTFEPVPSTSGTGPLNPEYSPQYPSDNRIVVGGLAINPQTGGLATAVHTCRGTVCDTSLVGGRALPASVRLAPDFSASNQEIAFTEQDVFRSDDGGATFNALTLPGKMLVRDVALLDDGRMLLAAVGTDAGLYSSSDGGRTWAKSTDALTSRGVTSISGSGSLIAVSLAGKGLACTVDGGQTWAPRCAAAPTS